MEMGIPQSKLGTSSSEVTWFAAAKRGEPWALERLYLEYHSQIYRLCRRMLRADDDAEDAMQTVFVQAFQAIGRFRGNSSVKTWLYRIAINTCLAQLRQRSAVETVDYSDNMAQETSGASAEQLAVQMTLEKLPPEPRALLVMLYWEQLSYVEIAEVMGLSLSAAKMRIKRAREAFEKIYGGRQ